MFYREKKVTWEKGLDQSPTRTWGRPREGWEGVGGPPPLSLVGPIRPRGQRRETIKQRERQVGSSHHDSRRGKIVRTV